MLREVRNNLADKPPEAVRAWISLRPKATVEEDELTFEASKDKPILFTALACADVLLTRDLLGQTIYGLRVVTPGEFLRIEREGGRLP